MYEDYYSEEMYFDDWWETASEEEQALLSQYALGDFDSEETYW